jgi:hypothetical protein
MIPLSLISLPSILRIGTMEAAVGVNRLNIHKVVREDPA